MPSIVFDPLRHVGPSAKAFGAALARLRREQGLTLAELSRRSGLPVAELEELERGERREWPHLEQLFAVERGLGMKVSAILRSCAGESS